MKRREFLQQAGLALATLGISEASLWQWSDRALAAIAKPTSRKLALLVGINQYPLKESLKLQGCLTDVELQRELLVDRLGFSSRDILTLTNEQATREQIESAFINHLISQVRPDDVVVFHFSGYGRSVQTGETPAELQSSLVPIDGNVPQASGGQINDLLESTLQLLLKSLKTTQVVTLLDTSYGTLERQQVGVLRGRSYPHLKESWETRSMELTPEVQALQDQLRDDLKADAEQLRVQRRFGQLPGVVISAAMPIQRPIEQAPSQGLGEQAFESQWNGFSAGLLTYQLTQHLWLAAPETRLSVSLATVSNQVQKLAGDREQPHLSGEKSQDATQTLTQWKAADLQGAEGRVAEIGEDGKSFTLWLGGLPPEVLNNYQPSSLFTLTPTPESLPGSIPLIQLRSIEGLKAKAVMVPGNNVDLDIEEGDLIQESVRYLSRSLNLVVGICQDLERIERVDATSAFSGIPNVSTVVLGELTQAVNCVFSKGINSNLSQGINSHNSYGLFSPGLDLIPHTMGETDEAVKTAIRRLMPTLDALWAMKLLQLTVNPGSSRLAVRATLEKLTPEREIIARQEPARSPLPRTSAAKIPSLLNLEIGSRIGYRLHNQEDRPLYVMLFGLDRSGALELFQPSKVSLSPKSASPSSGSQTELNVTVENQQLVIPPGASIFLPEAIAPVEWTVCCGDGLAHTQILFSVAPFTQTAKVLKLAESSTGSKGVSGTVKNPGATAKAILEDLHQASRAELAPEWIKPDSYAFSVKAWCSLSFIYRVV
ncbi:MAG: caspase family protein [Roseofilum sp. SID2]|uniref:caspase family protein n=1 Tax=unclassified Roseofilum TaxID=2620099 RepID=UPI001B28889F|nr:MULTISPECIES: caspase family protein [unclassified Roseofilum]MBP0012938.1 caspase family protein [Roseofilum sp. SID3]MBP0022778.1 caspase family protein [Roseofilum sp. SID2]MBP0038844.1 caspase family protein [Roseofilum sp. SID1]